MEVKSFGHQILYIWNMRPKIPIDPSLLLRLEIEAKHHGLEVSELLKEAIQQFFGIRVRNNKNSSKLKELAGTWTQEEFEEFNRNAKSFGKIDQEMWQ